MSQKSEDDALRAKLSAMQAASGSNSERERAAEAELERMKQELERMKSSHASDLASSSRLEAELARSRSEKDEKDAERAGSQANHLRDMQRLRDESEAEKLRMSQELKRLQSHQETEADRLRREADAQRHKDSQLQAEMMRLKEELANRAKAEKELFAAPKPKPENMDAPAFVDPHKAAHKQEWDTDQDMVVDLISKLALYDRMHAHGRHPDEVGPGGHMRLKEVFQEGTSHHGLRPGGEEAQWLCFSNCVV